MESATLLRSVREPFLQKPTHSFASRALLQSYPWRIQFKGQSFVSLRTNQKQKFHVKAVETSKATSGAESIKENLDKPLEKNSLSNSVFPDGLEMMLQEVCDTTEVAEVILKIGDFEMLLKRDIGSTKPSASISPYIESPTVAPPIPSKPMAETSPAPPPVKAEKPTPDPNPFANVSASTASKLAALEASGSNAHVLVSSPTVGVFQRGRTLKGKRQPPSCKEGDIVKEGQIIGFLDQFGNELPVRSDVAGEVLKVLYQDGEPVGYGDPLIAVLPAFHGIK